MVRFLTSFWLTFVALILVFFSLNLKLLHAQNNATSFSGFNDFSNNYSIDYTGDRNAKLYRHNDKPNIIHVEIDNIPNDGYMAYNGGQYGIFYDIAFKDPSKNYNNVTRTRLIFSRVSDTRVNCNIDGRISTPTNDAQSNLNAKCVKNGDTFTFTENIDVNKIPNLNDSLTNRYMLAISLGHGINGPGDTTNIYYFPAKIPEYDVTYYVQGSKLSPCFTVKFSPSDWLIPGQPENITIENAVSKYNNSPCKAADDPSKAKYFYGVIQANSQGTPDISVSSLGQVHEDPCASDECPLSFSVPTDISQDTAYLVIAAANGTGNAYLYNLNVDRYWENIINMDTPQNGMALHCQQSAPAQSCGPMDNPNNDKSYKCHGNDSNNLQSNQIYVCPNSNEYVCFQGGSAKCSTIKPAYQNACASTTTKDGSTTCNGVNSPIGLIPSNPAKLVTKIFGLLLSLGGGIALIIIIGAGYRFINSQGRPEAIQEAREQLDSAIAGLLFIIFSFVIYQVITSDLLHIPGIN